MMEVVTIRRSPPRGGVKDVIGEDQTGRTVLMKNLVSGLGRRVIVALVATLLVLGVTAGPAEAANYWALRHDGPVPANRGAWNNQFTCATSAGAGPLYVNRNAIGQWEIFDFVLLGGQWIALKAKINGKYVTRQSNGILQATSTTLTSAQHFYVYVSGLSGGHFRLWHGQSQTYVRLDPFGALYADGTHFSIAGIFLQWGL
jgi:hypothetical protein